MTETQKFIDQINREVDPTLARWIANRVKEGIPLDDIKQRIRNAMQFVHHPATVGAPEEGPVVAVITEVRVPWETIINAFVGVCETSASTYWLSSFQPLEPECSGLVASCREAKEPWYATLDFWGKGGRATLRHDDPSNDDQQTNTIIGETEIISGLNAMANKCPKHFADLVSENDDAITHDVMIQCIVFGEIIYG